MEKDEKLSEAELRKDADFYMYKICLRSEIAMFIVLPLFLLLCFVGGFNNLREMILLAIFVFGVALTGILDCITIKSIDYQNFTLNKIADRMKMLRKRRRLIHYVVCACFLIYVAVISFLNWGFSLKSFIMIAVWFLIVVVFSYFRKRSLNNDDYDDMISQLENFQQTDL